MKLDLIFPNKEYVKNILPVTSLSTMDKHAVAEDGLFSTRIFGPLDSEERMSRFSYIKLNTFIIHPRLYKNLISINNFYKLIAESKAYAVFEDGDFRPIRDEEVGDTGYGFFANNISSLKLTELKSPIKNTLLKVVKKYIKKGTLTNNNMIVLPAGMRDISIDSDGRTIVHELNDYYKRVMNISNMIGSSSNNTINDVTDRYRLSLHRAVEETMEQIFLILKDKKGHIGGSVTGRKVDYGTMNVISGNSETIEDLREVKDTDILAKANIGLLQYAKSVEPLTKFAIKTFFGLKTIDTVNGTSTCYDSKGKPLTVAITQNDIDLFTSKDSLSTLINRYKDYQFRDKFVTFKTTDRKAKIVYPYLISFEDNEARILMGEDVPKDFHLNKTNTGTRPISYGEMLTLALTPFMDDVYGTMTRHPIADQGSDTPLKFTIKTTIEVININVTLNDIKLKVFNLPKLGNTWDESLSPSYTLLDGYGADFDGDTLAVILAISEESKSELKQVLKEVKSFIRPNGKPLKDVSDYISEIMMKTLTA